MQSQLSQLDLFAGIASKTLDRIAEIGNILDLSKGTVLIRAREPESSIFIQLTGKSIVYNLTYSGKRKILFVFGAGTLLNEHMLNNHTSSVYCEILEKSKVLEIPCKDFVKLMSGDYMLMLNVLSAQEKKMWRLSHQLKNTMSSIYMERKFAAKLWKLARDFGIKQEDGIEIDINITGEFLADMLGVSRETASRTCGMLVDNGLIKMRKKRIVIPDSDKLSNFYKSGKII